MKFDHDGHKQELKEVQKVGRRPNVIDPTLVRAAQLSDVKVLKKFRRKNVHSATFYSSTESSSKSILVVNHVCANPIHKLDKANWQIVRTMHDFCLAEFKDATVKRVTREG